MKKAISGILCLVFLALGAVSVQATAIDLANLADFADQQDSPPTRLAYINTTNTTLGISGGQAISEGSIVGYSGITTKVTVALYLERKKASATTWTTVSSGSKTTNGHVGAHQLKTAVTSGYQYRVRAVYTAYSGSNYETLTSYSGVKTY
jgi:hypothetical protein